MRKRNKLIVLLGVFLVVCASAFAVSRYEGKKEQIKTSGEVILEIPKESVTALSWTNESGTFSFTKSETWVYDGDADFPVDGEKIEALLSEFESFAAAFTIDGVDDFAQYGLSEPVCSISITSDGETRTIELGDFSKMDEQRYVSIGDGRAYLAVHDPLEEFDAVFSDMILNDELPDFDTAEEITFSGDENYVIVRDENGSSLCSDDVFFSGGSPLDTERVESFLDAVRSIELDDFVTYNASDEELEKFGLLDPELTIELKGSEGGEESADFVLNVSRNVEEVKKYERALEKGSEDLPSVTCYVRVGASQIVYKISQSKYDSLTDVSFDALRHQELFTGDFDEVSSIDVSLGGEAYTFTRESEKDGTWTYLDEEFDITELENALCAVTASEFSAEETAGQEEISLTLHLDNEAFPEFTLTLYRYDGASCVAFADGEQLALVPRSQTVELAEAVNEVILGSGN